MIRILTTGLLLFIGSAPAEQPTDPAQAQSPSAAVPDNEAAIDLESANPPSTRYDKATTTNTGRALEEKSLLAEIGRMLLGLLFVVALIYLVGRLGLSRLTALRTGISGQHLKLIERLQLDTKNSIFLVEVNEETQLLLGGSEGNLRLISHLPPTNEPESGQSGRRFRAAMENTHISEVDSTVQPLLHDKQHARR